MDTKQNRYLVRVPAYRADPRRLEEVSVVATDPETARQRVWNGAQGQTLQYRKLPDGIRPHELLVKIDPTDAPASEERAGGE